MSTSHTVKPGEINSNSLYTLDELMARLGLGRKAMRAARREGLVVKHIWRRAYVLGSDFIDWYKQSAKSVG